MAITTQRDEAEIVVLPELLEADRRYAARGGIEPLGEQRLRECLLLGKQVTDQIKASGLEIEESPRDPDDPYDQRGAIRRFDTAGTWIPDDPDWLNEEELS